MHSRSNSFPIVLFMLSFITVTGMLVTPALPTISGLLNIDASQSNALMTMFLVGFGLGQLPFGPLANKLGRKKALIIGVTISLIGSLIQVWGVFASQIDLLLIGRFMSAFGGAAGSVVAILLVTDVCTEHEARKTMSSLVLFFAILPSVTIFVGAQIVQNTDWSALFWLAVIINILAFFLCFVIRETASETKLNQQGDSKNIFASFWALLRVKSYLNYVLIFSIGAIICFLFSSLAPVLAIEGLKISASKFGELSLITSLGMLVGAYLSGRLSDRFNGDVLLAVAIAGVLISNIVVVALFQFYELNWATLYIPAFVFFACSAVIMSNGPILALYQVEDTASGTSLMNAANLLIASSMVWLGGYFIKHTALILPLILIVAAIMGIFLLVSQSKARR